jgi:hypothetical protein
MGEKVAGAVSEHLSNPEMLTGKAISQYAPKAAESAASRQNLINEAITKQKGISAQAAGNKLVGDINKTPENLMLPAAPAGATEAANPRYGNIELGAPASTKGIKEINVVPGTQRVQLIKAAKGFSRAHEFIASQSGTNISKTTLNQIWMAAHNLK